MKQLIVLDTHVIVWSIKGDRRLGVETRGLIKRAISAGAAVISAATSYEFTWIASRGRALVPSPAKEALRSLATVGITVLAIDGRIAEAAAALDLDQGDPIDRLIAATVLLEDGLLVTADEKLLANRLKLRTHDARL